VQISDSNGTIVTITQTGTPDRSAIRGTPVRHFRGEDPIYFWMDVRRNPSAGEAGLSLVQASQDPLASLLLTNPASVPSVPSELQANSTVTFGRSFGK